MSDPTPNPTPTPAAPAIVAPMLPATQPSPDCALTFGTRLGLEALQRAGRLFSTSPLVPKEYQGDNGMSSCAIALDLANRIGANPLMVMQNLYIVHGRPGWSAKFKIATFNQCGKFTSIRYEFSGVEGNEDWGCRAWATEKSTGERLEGPKVTIKLANAEGWVNKPGSKWKTMPEQMLRYRSASWFVDTVAPELSMGLPMADEMEDIEGEVIPQPIQAGVLPVAALPALVEQPTAAATPASASGRLARLKPKDVTPSAEQIPTGVNPDDKVRNQPTSDQVGLAQDNGADELWPDEQ